MADELRTCRRTGCRWPAAASLSYRYDSRQVWLLDMAEQTHPALYDLCPHHADHLTLPRGWHLVDQRTTPEVIVEPAAVDRVAQTVASPAAPPVPGAAAVPTSGGWTSSRYAALAADLPRLAASLADHPDLRAEAAGGTGAAHADAAAAAAPRAEAGASPPGSGVTIVRPRVATGEHGQIAGQLAIPVEELPPLGAPRGAVVVSIQRAGQRTGQRAGGRRRGARDTEL